MVNLFDKEHQEFLEVLNKHKVEYLLIGGMAVNIHGYSRGTGDIDIWISSSPENKLKMVKAISEFGYDTKDYEKMKPNEITMLTLENLDSSIFAMHCGSFSNINSILNFSSVVRQLIQQLVA